MTDHDLAAKKKAVLEAAIRNHYDDPDGRRILAHRGVQLSEDDDTSTDRQVAS